MVIALLTALGAWVAFMIVWTLFVSFVRMTSGQFGALMGMPPYGLVVRLLGWFAAAYFAAMAFHAVA